MKIVRSKIVPILIFLLLVSVRLQAGEEKKASVSDRKILVEEWKDRLTGCTVSYEYYKSPDGKKILHGKYKREWSIPKTDRSAWSGREVVTATFAENRLNGVVTIKCEKYKWKRKSEFIKGKGRVVSLVIAESYLADNLKLMVKNDTLVGAFNFEFGNLKYEVQGKVNEAGEVVGKYTLYRKENTEQESNRRRISTEWTIEEQYMCDPDYTYKEVIPKVAEVVLGYPGTSRGDQIRIRIPKLKLSMIAN